MVACIFGVILNTWARLSPHQGVGGFVTHGCLCCAPSPLLLSGYDFGVKKKKKRRNSSGTGQEIQRYILLSYCGGVAVRLSRPKAPQSENQGPSLTGLEWKGLFWGRCPAK